MDARVIRAFHHTNTGLMWYEGQLFEGSEGDAAQLVQMGYLAFEGEPARPDLEAMTVKELSAICAERGIEVPKKAKKADIVAAIRAAG